MLQVFTVIFTVEAIIKLTALSKDYFRVGWNILDLVIVGLSLPDLLLYIPTLGETAGYEDVARFIKICRLVNTLVYKL